MMVLDQCVPSTVGRRPRRRAAMELTHRWARRSLAARGDSPQALFAHRAGRVLSRICARESARVIDARCPSTASPSAAWRWARAKAEREECTAMFAVVLRRRTSRAI